VTTARPHVDSTPSGPPRRTGLRGERVAAFRAWQARVSDATTYLFFEVETSEGRVGTGEATMSRDDQQTARTAEALFSELVAGHEVSQIPALLTRCATAVGLRPSRSAGTALSGLEHCLLDLRGQELGLPVYELLGGLQRERVRLYANINRGMFGGDRSPEIFAQTAVRARDEGFGVLKIAPFDNVRPGTAPDDPAVRAGVARIAAVRAAVGEDVGILVDCHGRLGVPTCYSILPELVDLRLGWLEEPFVVGAGMQAVDPPGAQSLPQGDYPPAPLTALQELARRSPLPLAGAESEFGLQSFKEILDTGALSVVMADVKHCGGISVTRAIGELAGSYGVGLAPHNPSGPVATVASMHVCLATPAFEILEYQWGEVPERDKMITPGEGLERGWLVPSGAPGLGVALDHESLAARATSVTRLA
jgi:galactonate dehydratase